MTLSQIKHQQQTANFQFSAQVEENIKINGSYSVDSASSLISAHITVSDNTPSFVGTLSYNSGQINLAVAETSEENMQDVATVLYAAFAEIKKSLTTSVQQ